MPVVSAIILNKQL